MWDSQGLTDETLKIPSIQIFKELGEIFNMELKKFTSEMKGQNPQDKIFHFNEIADVDVGNYISKEMQFKIGAYLTNLMCKNLTYSVGKKKFLLLNPKIDQKKANKK